MSKHLRKVLISLLVGVMFVTTTFANIPIDSREIKGVDLIPLRATCQKIGARVDWKRVGTVVTGRNKLTAKQVIAIPKLTETHYGKMYVPVRFFEDNFGHTVDVKHVVSPRTERYTGEVEKYRYLAAIPYMIPTMYNPGMGGTLLLSDRDNGALSISVAEDGLYKIKLEERWKDKDTHTIRMLIRLFTDEYQEVYDAILAKEELYETREGREFHIGNHILIR